MSAHPEVFLGRQPILDRDQRLFAYELLFRTGHHDCATDGDNVQMTATVIINTFNELGVEAALGQRRGFINVDERFLFSDSLEFLPPASVVLEILETVPATAEVIARCRELRSAGYTLALDDVTQIRPGYEPLIALADIIKIDIAPLDDNRIALLAAELRPLRKHLLAEKVETRARMEFCKQQGFALFQGYYFARPSVITSRRVDHKHLSLMRLLSMAMDDAETHDLESELKHEAGLVVKMLRMINSAAGGMITHITSLRHAITILGRRQLIRWLQLLIFASNGEPGGGNPLLNIAATRGRMLELLAAKMAPSNPTFVDQAFLTGMMSMLPIAFGIAIDEVATQLHLPEEINAALTLHEGPLGQLLKLVETLEENDFERVAPLLAALNLDLNALNRAHTAAIAWSARIEDEAGSRP